MYEEPRNGPLGRSRSEGLARLGAIFVWSSVAVMLISMMIFYTFAIAESSTGITEDDFEDHAPGEWRTTVSVSSFGTITGTITAEDDNFKVKVIVYDDSGNDVETYNERTPLTFSAQIFEAGEYEIAVVIEVEGKTIDDLDIQISGTSVDSVLLCCGGSFFVIIDIGLFLTGFIILLVAIFRRKEELHPPRPIMRYRPPQPPYYGGPQGYQMYQRAPPMYQQFSGPQNEGYLGYEGPPQQVQRAYYTDGSGVDRW